jgi:LysM repeat protein
MHQKYFQREKSLFVTKSGRDKEENFYIYKYKDLMECGGHYIYYEKNMEMQNYMISSRKKVGFTPSEIIEDRVTKNFRSIIREKEERNEQKSHSRLVYGISTFLIVILLVIGVNMMNNYEKMQEMKEALGEEQEESVEVSGEPLVQETEQEEEVEIEVETEEETKEETVVPEVLKEEKETYVVQKGDTLESISKQKYGDVLRVAEICELNQLEDGNLIFIGQKLLLP